MQNVRVRSLIIFLQTRRFRHCRSSKIYYTPKKIQPITIHQMRFPSCAARVALGTVLATVFSMGWLENSYATLSLGIPRNIPLVTCILSV